MVTVTTKNTAAATPFHPMSKHRRKRHPLTNSSTAGTVVQRKSSVPTRTVPVAHPSRPTTGPCTRWEGLDAPCSVSRLRVPFTRPLSVTPSALWRLGEPSTRCPAVEARNHRVLRAHHCTNDRILTLMMMQALEALVQRPRLQTKTLINRSPLIGPII